MRSEHIHKGTSPTRKREDFAQAAKPWWQVSSPPSPQPTDWSEHRHLPAPTVCGEAVERSVGAKRR